MTKTNSVSVVIPAHNAASFIAEALASVFAQSHPVHEVIVVDDGSTDRIDQAVEPFLNRITFVEQPNRGASAARNAGLSRATGEFIALLDADDIWLPDKIAIQLDALRDQDAAACFSPVTERADWPPCGKAICPASDLSDDQFWCRLWYGNFVQPSTIVMRTEAVRKAGLFDEGIRFCEDWEYWFRLLAVGRFVQAPKALCYYRTHPNQMTANAYFEAIYLRKARLQIIDRHGDRLKAAGITRQQQRQQLQERYRSEILSAYFKRQLRGTRQLLWQYAVRHPLDLEILKYSVLSLMPRSLLVRLRGS